jgi:hypothetical protein
MEFAVKFAWSVVALIHLPPAAVVAAPRLIPSLYGVAPDGALGLLLVHRGVLFLAIVAACIFAALDPAARRVVSVVASISVVGFLAIYVQAGPACVRYLRGVAASGCVDKQRGSQGFEAQIEKG